eukprot:101406-Chlamydomonas_euryale.AAC.14
MGKGGHWGGGTPLPGLFTLPPSMRISMRLCLNFELLTHTMEKCDPQLVRKTRTNVSHTDQANDNFLLVASREQVPVGPRCWCDATDWGTRLT